MAKFNLLSQYIDSGFALVPLPQGSKGPVTKGWNQRNNCITDVAGLSRITDGVGLAHAYSSPVTCSLDIDDLVDATQWLSAKGIDLQGLLNAAGAVQIVSGKPNKAKLLYRFPDQQDPLPTFVVKDGSKTILEFRCASKDGLTVQDVLPPSIHPDTGKAYEWGGDGHFSDIPVMPPSLVDLWKTNSVKQPPLNKPVDLGITHSLLGFPETQENIDKVTQALSQISADCMLICV